MCIVFLLVFNILELGTTKYPYSLVNPMNNIVVQDLDIL